MSAATDVICDVICAHTTEPLTSDNVEQLSAKIAERIMSTTHTYDAKRNMRMTDAQIARLVNLCRNYGVFFREDDYYLYPLDAFTCPGWVEGWVGGRAHNGEGKEKRTIYVGVSPEGESHS